MDEQTQWNKITILALAVCITALCLSAAGFMYGYVIGKISALSLALVAVVYIFFGVVLMFRVPVEK